MRKKLFAKLSVVLALVLAASFALTGCGMFGGSPAEYTIQYSDDAGTHTLTVTKGALYTLESVPYRYGYEFEGLFDAETDGKQYVGSNGAAVAPYPDKKNRVLYPHFKPIDYTVILDYGEAAVTGDRSFTVAYDAKLPDLPTGLTLAHNTFMGWYTKEACGGTQVADAYGNIPETAVFNSANFSPDDENRRAYLYAGFELEKFAVTFHFGGELADETLQIPYGTPIGNIVPKTRNDEKQAVLLWSTQANDTEKQNIFTGTITEARELYAAEWAPVIELDGDGVEVTPVVARAGADITLPTPTKPFAEFLRWETLSGQTANITKMPVASTSLKAVWQGKFEFDENGGTEVEDISEPAGSDITLPIPEKEGYLFAGWYTADKERYTAVKMPSVGAALKAGWYKEKYADIVVLQSNSTVQCESSKATFDNDLTIKMSKYLPKTFEGIVKLNVTWQEKHTNASGSSAKKVGIEFYSSHTMSDIYLLGRKVTTHYEDTYETVSYAFTANLTGNEIYVAVGCDGYTTFGWGHYDGYFMDMKVALTYPDTTYLYL